MMAMEKLKRLGIEKIYCVNLKKCTKRWSRVSKRFEDNNLKVTRFEAITPNHPFVDHVLKTKNTHNKSRIYIACSLSQIKIWEEAYEKGYDKIIVFEDDVKLIKNFSDEVVKLVTTVESMDNYDLIMLDMLATHINLNLGVHKVHGALLADAYIVKRSAIKLMLDMYNKNEKFMDCETMLLDIQNKDHSYTCMPFLAIQELNDTNIQTEEHINKLKKWYTDHYYPSHGHKYK